MNTTQHPRTPPSRIERLLAHLANHLNASSSVSGRVDLVHGNQVALTPGDR